jgi:hypothetical protein
MLFGSGVVVFAVALCAVLFYGYAVFNRSYDAGVVERPGFGTQPTILVDVPGSTGSPPLPGAP